jgi:hypothetical protein
VKLRLKKPAQRPPKQEWRTTWVLAGVALGLFALLVIMLVVRYD